MVNVGKYTIHGLFGSLFVLNCHCPKMARSHGLSSQVRRFSKIANKRVGESVGLQSAGKTYTKKF